MTKPAKLHDADLAKVLSDAFLNPLEPDVSWLLECPSHRQGLKMRARPWPSAIDVLLSTHTEWLCTDAGRDHLCALLQSYRPFAAELVTYGPNDTGPTDFPDDCPGVKYTRVPYGFGRPVRWFFDTAEDRACFLAWSRDRGWSPQLLPSGAFDAALDLIPPPHGVGFF